MSLCDLAGSERCTKTESFGERLKEAGNINNSLLILGKCIGALKQNQNGKMRQNYIPFRESKLTRLFQPFFCGKGLACMIVNINQCASNYDETLHVMKFSAVAKDVVQTLNPRVLEFLTPRLVGKDGKPIHVDANTSIEDLLSEEDFLEDEDEMDFTVLSQEELLSKITNLKEKLVTERQSKFVLEIQIRKEMGEEMLQQLLDLENTWSKRCESLKETYEEQFEDRFEMYKKAIQKHSYNCAMKEIEETHVPVEELEAEQEKVKKFKNAVTMLKNSKKYKLNTTNCSLGSSPIELSSSYANDKLSCCKTLRPLLLAYSAIGHLHMKMAVGIPDLRLPLVLFAFILKKDRENRILELEMSVNPHRPPGTEPIFNREGNLTDLQNVEMSSTLEQIRKQSGLEQEQCDLQEEMLAKATQTQEDEVIEKLKEENQSIMEENQSIKTLLEQKEQEIEALLNARKRVQELETTVLELKEELHESTRLSSVGSLSPKPKRGFFSALNEAIAGTPKQSSDQSKATAFDETHGSSRKRPMSRKRKE